MTVPSETNRSGPYNGNGSTTVFGYGFRIVDEDHLRVIRTSALGVETVLAIDTDYIVSDVGEPAGGQIACTVAPASGETITILRNIPFVQETDLENQGAYYAETVEDALDLAAMRDQQLSEEVGRAIKVPASYDGGASLDLPTPESLKFIAWNEAGDGLRNADASELVSVAAYGTANADIFTGDGATTEFELSDSPAVINNLDVSVGGVTQLPGDDYTWSSGTTLTFTTAPANGAKILVRYMQALAQGTTNDDLVLSDDGAGGSLWSNIKGFITYLRSSAGSSIIGFIQAGVGSAARTMQSKARDIVSAKDFGAVGDGVAADAAALIAATDKSILPAGTYAVASAVNKEFDFLPGAQVTGAQASTVWPKGLRNTNGNYYVATWSSSTTLGNRPLTLHSSMDGVNFKHLATITTDADGVTWDFGDPSIFYHNGMWYVTFTSYVTDQYDFAVARSRNLTDWTVTKCKFGTGVYVTNGTAPGWSYVFATGPWVWAPKFIKAADGTIYLTASIRTQADQTTLEGTQPFFRQFIATCTDIDALTFSAATELQIDSKVGPGTAAANTQNRLDGSILQRPDGTWAMAIKDDYNKWVNVCTCATINGNWATVKTDAVPLHPGGGVNYVEGPSLIAFSRGGVTRYRLYADKYYGNHQFFVESDDLLTYTAPATVQVDCVIRHGRVLNLGQIPRGDMAAAVDSVSKASLFLAKPPRSDIKAMFNLNDVAGFPSISNFAPMNGCLYRLQYDASNLLCTINSFAAVGTLPEGSYFYLAIYAGNSYLNSLPARIRFPAGATNLIPNAVDFWIGQHLVTGDTLFKFILVDGSWRVESLAPVEQLSGRAYGDVRLNTITNFPNINNGNTNWWPISGQTYFNIDADGACTITSIPTTGYPDGAEVYFSCRASTSGGNITLKAGAHAHWPADLVFTGTTDNSVHFTIRKIAGKWAFMK